MEWHREEIHEANGTGIVLAVTGILCVSVFAMMVAIVFYLVR
jgi:hypothetical protein